MPGTKKATNAPQYEVEQIVSHRQTSSGRLYRVKWKGYPSNQNTWEPVSHLDHCPEILEAYEAKLKNGPAAPKDEPMEPASDPSTMGEKEENESAAGDSWEVEEIMNHRKRNGVEEYQVKWEGDDTLTWEPVDNLNNCTDLLEKYWNEKGKAKRGPQEKAVKSTSRGKSSIRNGAQKKTTGRSVPELKQHKARADVPEENLRPRRGRKTVTAEEDESDAGEKHDHEAGEVVEDVSETPSAPATDDEIHFSGIAGYVELISGEKFYEAWVKDGVTGVMVPAQRMESVYPDEIELLLKKIVNVQTSDGKTRNKVKRSKASPAE